MNDTPRSVENLDELLGKNEYFFVYQNQDYVIEEISYDDECKWKNRTLKLVKPDKNGKITAPEGMQESLPILVSLAMKKIVDGDRVPVREEFIRNLPTRTQKFLFDKTREICNFDKEEDTEASLKQQKAIIEEKLRVFKANSEEEEAKN